MLVTLTIRRSVRQNIELITKRGPSDILSNLIQLIAHFLHFNSTLCNVKYGTNHYISHRKPLVQLLLFIGAMKKVSENQVCRERHEIQKFCLYLKCKENGYCKNKMMADEIR